MINSPRVCVRVQKRLSNRNLLRKKSATSSLTPSPFATWGGVRFSFSAATGLSPMDTVADGSPVKGGRRTAAHPCRRRVSIYQRRGYRNAAGHHAGHYEMIDSNGVPFNIEILSSVSQFQRLYIKQWLHTLLATFMVATMN